MSSKRKCIMRTQSKKYIFQDILIYNSIYQVIIDFDREGTSVNCIYIPDTDDMSIT